MLTIRKELTAYMSACEHLLSSSVHPALNQDERDLIAYYIEELARQYKPERTGSHHTLPLG